MDSVPLTQEMKANIKDMMLAKAMADARLQTYLQGCKDGLKLDGDWNIDLKTMEFTPVVLKTVP